MDLVEVADIPLPEWLAPAVQRRLERYDAERIGERMWAKDHTVWKDDPTEISNRLRWLWAPEHYRDHVDDLNAFAAEIAAEGYESIVVLGMGGSSLAPEVLHAVTGPVEGRPRLYVLDSTDPTQVIETERAAGLDHTLFVVSSKSGGTIETMSQYAHFRSRVHDGRNFIAITDPGSNLERIAEADGFRRTFLNDPDIGGRFSGLSYFGLVPGALCGADIAATLESACAAASRCHAEIPAAENPAAVLGVILGEASLAGSDKLTFFLPPGFASFGWWVEQLIAESSGKEGKGILPVEGEPRHSVHLRAKDRVFAVYNDPVYAAEAREAGRAVIERELNDPSEIGAEFYEWEFATAIACWVLDVNPFDQPNVQEAKDSAARFLAGESSPVVTQTAVDLLGTVEPGHYIAINAFVERNPTNEGILQKARVRLLERYGVATAVGFGPRFLHSTGQLHKGGASSGIFLQVLEDDPHDIPIPGKDYTFGQLKRAQADGDLASLLARKQRVTRLTLEELTQAS